MHLSINRPRFRRVASGLVCALLVLPCMGPAAARVRRGPKQITCEACLVLDAGTGEVFFGRAIHRRLPNASTTKMMTALIAGSASAFGEPVRVSAAAATVGGGGLDLDAGEIYRVRDLLYALLLDSSNEAAAALAEHWLGGQAAFVRRMNETARRLGASDTNFVNPHGLDAPGHYSSAHDLALIAQELLGRPRLAAIVATPRRTISTPGGPVVVENRNLLLESYRGAVGVKTGRTLGAGEVLVAAARRGSFFLIAVAMRAVDAAADVRRLLDLGFARARERAERAGAPGLLLSAREQVGAVVFDTAGATAVVAGADLEGVTPPGGVEVTFEPYEPLVLPLRAGQQIGTVQVMSRSDVLGSVPALAADPVPSAGASWGTRALAGLLRSAASVVDGIAS